MNRTELVTQLRQKKSFLCVGLDTDITKLPKHLLGEKDPVFAFNKAIIDATRNHCISYKINTAFYESRGIPGWASLEKTLHYIPKTHFTIADAKRGDIGNTSSHYAKTFFETFPFDSVTVAPYMGEDSIRPFLEYDNKWTIVLGLTSNAGSQDFQQLSLSGASRQQKLYETVLQKVSGWGSPSNLMFVVGATKANDLTHIRSLLPDHFLLVPGVGAQGGSLKEVAGYGLNKEGGLLVNASRAILFAGGGEDFAEKANQVAKDYHAEMTGYLS